MILVQPQRIGLRLTFRVSAASCCQLLFLKVSPAVGNDDSKSGAFSVLLTVVLQFFARNKVSIGSEDIQVRKREEAQYGRLIVQFLLPGSHFLKVNIRMTFPKHRTYCTVTLKINKTLSNSNDLSCSSFQRV